MKEKESVYIQSPMSLHDALRSMLNTTLWYLGDKKSLLNVSLNLSTIFVMENLVENIFLFIFPCLLETGDISLDRFKNSSSPLVIFS